MARITRKKFEQMIEEMYFPKLPYKSFPKDYDEAKNTKPDMCSECKGKCCKNCGCHFSPDDFKEISFKYLKRQIMKGYISIEYVDGEVFSNDIGTYILRVRNVGMGVVDDGIVRSPCILLTKKGCKLKYKDRPSGGKLLVPRIYHDEAQDRDILACENKYSIYDCCYEWLPHKKILSQLVQYFGDKDVPFKIH